MRIQTFQIGEVATQLSVSTDTLRYYEKIGLLSKVNRTPSGLRAYSDKDISKLKFIKRAQRMNFTLEEISQLLDFREQPLKAKPKIRQIAYDKLQEIEQQLDDLTTLRNELTLLVNLCTSDKDSCPIITNLNDN